MSDVNWGPPPGAAGPPPGAPGMPGGPGWGWAGAQGQPYVPVAPQPGVIPLRPLGTGDILRAVLAVVSRYGKVLYHQLLGVTVAVLLVVPAYAAFADAALSGIVADLQRDPYRTATGGQLAAMIAVAGGGWLLLVGFALATQVIATATGTKVVQHAVLGRPVTARQLAAEARPYLWPVFGSFLLLGLSLLVVMAVGLLPVVIADLAGAGPFSLLLFPLAVLSVGVGMYAQVRLVLQMPVLILEGVRPVAAVRRAWRLNEGAWWRSLGIPYLVSLIGSTVAQILLLPFFVLGFVLMFALGETGVNGSWEPGAASVIGLAASLCTGVLVVGVAGAPLIPVTNALLYVDRRIRRESLDVALAQAAGLHPAPSHAAAAHPGPPSPRAEQPPTAAPGPSPEATAPSVPAQDPGRGEPASERPDPGPDADADAKATGPAPS
ncbi:hypothetical protein [Kitasatospora sp. NPDC057015]|uniref:hypothetical protein n=1 Tax=Kitasatospora sp. NPDC057015 TaxID=3346001 RepID=UPI003644A882